MNVAAVESLLVKGNTGNDSLVGQNGIGTLTSLTLDGGNGDDILLGGAGDDTLLGGADDDVLIGGPGLDTLDGGPGNNILIQD
jgi:Ca2+-binding RTX toxin-like protein